MRGERWDVRDKMKKVFFTLILILCIIPNIIYASNETLSQDTILESQQESLDINSFIEEADKYTHNVYEDIDMGELFSSAITGSIDNQTLFNSLVRAMRWRSAR